MFPESSQCPEGEQERLVSITWRTVLGRLLNFFPIHNRDQGERALDSTDVLLGTLPFTHISGLLFYNTAFAVGATVVLFAKAELNDILSAIQTHKVS